jgi:Na+/H+ antiporter NhaB
MKGSKRRTRQNQEFKVSPKSERHADRSKVSNPKARLWVIPVFLLVGLPLQLATSGVLHFVGVILVGSIVGLIVSLALSRAARCWKARRHSEREARPQH